MMHRKRVQDLLNSVMCVTRVQLELTSNSRGRKDQRFQALARLGERGRLLESGQAQRHERLIRDHLSSNRILM